MPALKAFNALPRLPRSARDYSCEHRCAATLPYRDTGLPLGDRVEDLLCRLTPEERFAMLHQYSPAIPHLGAEQFRTGTETLHGIAWLSRATTSRKPSAWMRPGTKA